MIESYLEYIASNENGHYTTEDYKISFLDGSRSPQTNHKVQFDYNDSFIDISIQTG